MVLKTTKVNKCGFNKYTGTWKKHYLNQMSLGLLPGLILFKLVSTFMQLGFSSFSDSNQSNNWQKVQYNTDLIKQRHINLHTNESFDYEWKFILKWGKNIGEVSGELYPQLVFNFQVCFLIFKMV